MINDVWSERLIRLYPFARRQAGQDCWDILQDVAACLSRMPDGRLLGIRNLDSYLRKMITHATNSRRRKKTHAELDDTSPITAAHSRSVEDVALQLDLEEMLKSCSPEARQFFIWHAIENWTIDEIARKALKHPEAVKTAMRRAKDKLKTRHPDYRG